MRRFILFCILISGLVPAHTLLAEDKLIIYSGRSDRFVQPVVEAFAKKTGIGVVLHAGKSTELLNRLNLEKNKSKADLFISNDAGNLFIGSKLGLFKALPADLVKPVPSNYRATDNTWVGLSARARVLVVNKKFAAKNQLKSVFDLALPQLQDRIAITNSTNESYIAGITVYMASSGVDKTRQWLQGIKKNSGGKVYSKHSKIVDAVARGIKDVGLVNHYYIYRHLKEYPDDPIEIVIPDQGKGGMGIAWNVAGIALMNSSKQTTKATKFIKFVLSKEGQEIFAAVNREYPAIPGIKTSAEIPPAAGIKVANLPMSLLGEKRKETIDLIDAVGMP